MDTAVSLRTGSGAEPAVLFWMYKILAALFAGGVAPIPNRFLELSLVFAFFTAIALSCRYAFVD